MRQSGTPAGRRSNTRGAKNGTRKNHGGEAAIPFRALAKLASPLKPDMFLVDKLGCGVRTAKRYLSRRRKSRISGDALGVVLSEILRRLR